MTVSEWESGGKMFYTSFIRDITERKRLDRLKDEFVAMISHELRTPITSINGSLGLLQGGVTGELPPKAVNLVNIAYQNCERLWRLVNDLLDYQMIEDNTLVVVPKPQDIVPLVQKSVADTLVEAGKRDVSIVFRVSSTPIEVAVDEKRIAQIMGNLLSNATRHSPAGGTVDVSVSVAEGDDWVEIAVADTGDGIPDDYLPYIFQKFTQANNSDTRKTGGAGMGLAIGKALVECMNGEIDFETELGKGTTFRIRLPLHGGAALPQPAEPAAVAG